MAYSEYSRDAAIAAFFTESGTTVTREYCDEFARQNFGGPVVPVPLQGVFSYTLTAGPGKIVQFRIQSSQLDMETMALAGRVHSAVVADCAFHGLVGRPKSDGSEEDAGVPLAVYSMNELPGRNFVYVRGCLADDLPRHHNNVKSLARCVCHCLECDCSQHG